MSAGTGIVHSEYNRTKDFLIFYQIWIETNKWNVEPPRESRKFPTKRASQLTLLASGYSEDKRKALFINQEARIYGGKLAKGSIVEHNIVHQAYVLASNGTFSIENSAYSQLGSVTMNKGMVLK